MQALNGWGSLIVKMRVKIRNHLMKVTSDRHLVKNYKKLLNETF